VTTSPLLLLAIDASADDRATTRFQSSGRTPAEETAAVTQADFFSEAPSGFDGRTNGYLRQGAEFETINEDNVVPDRSFNDNRFIFEEVESIADGLGPTYNARSCAECHQNVATGGASQIAEHRTGRVDASGGFFESLGGSLIHSRATNAAIVERVALKTTCARSASRPTRSATASSNASPTNRCSRFATRNLPTFAARRSWCRCSKAATRCASGASAGRISTAVSSRSRRTRTSTRWASPARCSPTRTPRAAATSASARASIRSRIRRTKART